MNFPHDNMLEATLSSRPTSGIRARIECLAEIWIAVERRSCALLSAVVVVTAIVGTLFSNISRLSLYGAMFTLLLLDKHQFKRNGTLFLS